MVGIPIFYILITLLALPWIFVAALVYFLSIGFLTILASTLVIFYIAYLPFTGPVSLIITLGYVAFLITFNLIATGEFKVDIPFLYLLDEFYALIIGVYRFFIEKPL